jgi:hypothetical protein
MIHPKTQRTNGNVIVIGGLLGAKKDEWAIFEEFAIADNKTKGEQSLANYPGMGIF